MTATDDAPEVRVAGRYRLDRRIGAGGMGVVWQATDERLRRTVAIKEIVISLEERLDPDGRSFDESRNRVEREARIGARLQHPNVISVFDVVVHDDRPWLVMEYLPSSSLATVLAERGPLPPREAADIGRQVAAGLAAAHAAGVVHRDVTPGNVLIAEDGKVKITDFGVSRAAGDVQLTRTGLIAGTPAYLAPEVARGQAPTAESDMFALGATLYTAVEGEPPFGLNPNAFALLHQIAKGQVRPPQAAGPLTATMMQLLRAEPGERPTALAAEDKLAAVAAGRPPTLPEQPLAAGAGANARTIPAMATPAPTDAPRPDRTAQFQPAAAPPPPRQATQRPTQPPAGRAAAAASRPPRRRAIALAAALLVAAVSVVLVVTLQNSGSRTPAAASSPPVATSAPVTSQPAAAAPAPATSVATGREAIVKFIQDYYALLPGNTEAAWKLLGPDAQRKSGGFETFRKFYTVDLRSVQIVDGPRAVDDRTVQATIRFEDRNGKRSDEVYTYVVAPAPGSGLIMESFSQGGGRR